MYIWLNSHLICVSFLLPFLHMLWCFAGSPCSNRQLWWQLLQPKALTSTPWQLSQLRFLMQPSMAWRTQLYRPHQVIFLHKLLEYFRHTHHACMHTYICAYTHTYSEEYFTWNSKRSWSSVIILKVNIWIILHVI